MKTLPQRLREQAPEGLLSCHVSDIPALREAADELERLSYGAGSISDAAEKALLSRYSTLCRQMDIATAPGEFRPGVAESIRKEMALLLPLLKRPEASAL